MDFEFQDKMGNRQEIKIFNLESMSFQPQLHAMKNFNFLIQLFVILVLKELATGSVHLNFQVVSFSDENISHFCC